MPEEAENPGDVVMSPGRLCSSLRRSPSPTAAAVEEDPGGSLLIHSRAEPACFRLGPLLGPLQKEMPWGSQGSIHSRLGWTTQVLLEEDGGCSKNPHFRFEDQGSTSAGAFPNKTTSSEIFSSDLSSVREQSHLHSNE